MNKYLGVYIMMIFIMINYFFNTEHKCTNQINTKCKVWYLDSNNFKYPELKYKQFSNKKDIGIALPSGGYRASVYSLGVLRGLHHLGILQETKYITSVSGSSWLTSIYSYQNITSNEIFLGEYIEPENLTLTKISNIQNPYEFVSVLYGALPLLDYFKYLAYHILYTPINKNINDLWTQTLGGILYDKYNLNDFTLLPYINNTNNLNMVKLRDDVPLPIIIGSVNNYVSKTFIEFTPLYYGMPIKNNDINGTGIYIEPVCMLSITQNVLDNKHTRFNITSNNTRVISIMETASISSNVIPIKLNRMGLSLKNIDFIGFNSIKFLNDQLHMMDGGILGEHTGITSLIKRHVKNIIFVCPIITDIGVINTNEEMIRKNKKIYTYFNEDSLNYIFDKTQYKILLDKMIELGNNKKPVVVQMKMNIVSNNIYGIVHNDNYKPIITFIHPSKNEWQDKIHTTFKNYINSNKQNDYITRILSLCSFMSPSFRNFPYISFINQRYSLQLVNALSQNAAYDVVSTFDKLYFN
jgi:hypothetical protein